MYYYQPDTNQVVKLGPTDQFEVIGCRAPLHDLGKKIQSNFRRFYINF